MGACLICGIFNSLATRSFVFFVHIRVGNVCSNDVIDEPD
jgi:hypothetical protein